jgi:hypothetical protein
MLLLLLIFFNIQCIFGVKITEKHGMKSIPAGKNEYGGLS